MPVNIDSIFNQADGGDLQANPATNITLNSDLNIIDLPSELQDVVENLSWSVSNKALTRSEVPFIVLTEYQQTEASVKQAMEFWRKQTELFGSGANLNGTDGYESLYRAEPTNNVFKLPYYSEYHHNTSNSWAENRGKVQNWIDEKLVKRIQQYVLPGAGIEVAKQWAGSADNSFAFRFQLINTVNPETDIQNNYNFINALLYNNLMDRYNAIGIKPPVIYNYEIPGVRVSPAAVMTNISVTNVGQMNLVSGKDIPDAWEININMLDLVRESRQVFAGTSGGKVVTAISPPTPGA